MKKIAICFAGVAAGVGVAAATQYPVLETLGYLPEGDAAIVASADPVEEVPIMNSTAKEEMAVGMKEAGTDLSSASKMPQSEGSSKKQPESKASMASKRHVMKGSTAKETKTVARKNRRPEAGSKRKMKVADRAPSIKKSADMKSGKTVVAKPPMKDIAALAEPKAAPSKLTGKWKVIEAMHAGKKVASDRLGEMSLEFSEDSMMFHQGKKTEHGTIAVGREIEIGDLLVGKLEIQSSRKNVSPIQGFYFFEGDELNMIWGTPGEKLPVSMDSKSFKKSRVLKLVQ